MTTPLARSLRSVCLRTAPIAILLAVIACQDRHASPTGPQLTGDVSLEIVSGDGQSGKVGTQLQAPLVVKVGKVGFPTPFQVVNFRVVSGNGSVFGGTEMTNVHGIAQELWTLGTKTGEVQKVEVRVVDPNTGAPVVFATFTATATPDAPARLEPYDPCTNCGSPYRAAPVGSEVTDPQGVRVLDKYGNPVPGVRIIFRPLDDRIGPDIHIGNQLTDEFGIVAPDGIRLNELGPQSYRASLAGVSTIFLTHYSYRALGKSLRSDGIGGPDPRGEYHDEGFAGARVGPMRVRVFDSGGESDEIFEIRWEIVSGPTSFSLPFTYSGNMSSAFAVLALQKNVFIARVQGIGEERFEIRGLRTD